ncbi:hypothetical protein [Paenibacillus fonticola]|uniref:hypothetical protein n=1 Tax=Paenibacillus fonticola TaxID=379896 RepID=UPI00035CF1F4|nr:hypothetical protein [Paenibacillus fonticola]
MSTRKIGAFLFGVATFIVVGFTIYKMVTGKEVGFNEVVTIGVLLMMFFSTMTWGNKGEKDGIMPEEELGRSIVEKSSKISYYILTFFILVAVGADQVVHGSINVFLLAVLGLAIIISPIVEFLVARKYQ